MKWERGGREDIILPEIQVQTTVHLYYIWQNEVYQENICMPKH